MVIKKEYRRRHVSLVGERHYSMMVFEPHGISFWKLFEENPVIPTRFGGLASK